MYRDLAPGAAGADVQQLEGGLAMLGYAGFTVDDRYTSATATAVRAWQEVIGATVTGTVARGAVVFAPEFGQVGAQRSALGDLIAPGTPILDVTSTDQIVGLSIEVDDLDRFAVGTQTTIVLPGEDQVGGTVSNTVLVDPAPDPMSEDGNDVSESAVEAEITLDENVSEQLVGASVEVVVAVDERTDVLLVPVNALLALASGGYGLEIVAGDGTTSIVPVEVGLFADGKVEVTSADIAEGTIVAVAGR
jgi:peptidoglycan hydrolase-like protein with peptidoglycan-binding domain